MDNQYRADVFFEQKGALRYANTPYDSDYTSDRIQVISTQVEIQIFNAT